MTEHGEAQLEAAIEAVEARSRAELVVVVRASAGDYSGVDFKVAAVLAFGLLAFELYSIVAFALHWLLILPALVLPAAVAGLRAVPALRALFIRDAAMRQNAYDAAAATFFRKGIRHTRERTGILIFVALLEGEIVVLADSGVTEVVPEQVWAEATAPFAELLEHGGDASTLAAELGRLAEVLAEWCEVRDDDIDELPNTIDGGARR